MTLLRRVQVLLEREWGSVEVVDKAVVPIVRVATIGSVVGSGVKQLDIAAHVDGVVKSSSILAGLWAAPAVWPTLLLLLTYFRQQGVVKHMAGSLHPSDVAILAL